MLKHSSSSTNTRNYSLDKEFYPFYCSEFTNTYHSSTNYAYPPNTRPNNSISFTIRSILPKL